MSFERPSAPKERVPMRKYTYRDNSRGGAIVFECVTKDILMADTLYQAATGNDPVKQPYVGCSFEDVEA